MRRQEALDATLRHAFVLPWQCPRSASPASCVAGFARRTGELALSLDLAANTSQSRVGIGVDVGEAMAEDDWNFMQRVATGDDAAVGELYDRFGPLVYKAARQALPTRGEAEDAVQEIFVRLWRTADRYDPRRAKLVTWVMLITRRHLIDKLRRRGVRIEAGPLEADPAVTQAGRGGDPPVGSRLNEEQRQWLRDKLRDLPDLQRSVIERTYLQGFTLREVSEQLDAPLGTVKSALSRGLLRLRDRTSGDRAHG
jgi:RNA polymerase sigma-70 factor, ECF subfamily